MRRSLAFTLLSSALLALAGCKNPCRELSELLCECVEPFERETCLRTVASEESRLEPTAEQEQLCEQKLETCPIEPDNQETCRALETDAGKQACGIAR